MRDEEPKGILTSSRFTPLAYRGVWSDGWKSDWHTITRPLANLFELHHNYVRGTENHNSKKLDEAYAIEFLLENNAIYRIQRIRKAKRHD